jgi:DNA polymerase III subunit gamma/tau
MDAASNRGVDDMAALLDRAVYAPVQGRYKVYMIDEVHMLTGHAFNAMLKTLEEPPEHVKFILATTDPQKIPVTVLSRCLQFNLKQMSQGAIVDHLSHILGKEDVPFERPALSHIARAAGGSMRDALSLLDQAISHGAGKVGDDHLYGVLDGLIVGDVQAMLAVADAMEMRSLSFDSALQALASLLSRIALFQFAPGALTDDAERARIAPYAEALDAEYLQLAYQIAIHGRDELALAPDEYTGFTMTLLRLHAFRPEQPAALGGATPAGGGGAGRAQPMPTRVAAPAPLVKPVAASSAPPPPPEACRAEPVVPSQALEPPPWDEVPPAMPDDRPVSAQEMFDEAPAAAPVTAPQPPVAADAAGEVSAALAAADWHALQRALGPGGMLRELCLHCEWAGFADDTLMLRLANTHHHLLEMNAGAAARLSELLTARAGRPLRARVEIGPIESETPAQRHDAERRAKHAAAVEALESDPFVCEVIERFDARFVEESVRPL